MLLDKRAQYKQPCLKIGTANNNLYLLTEKKQNTFLESYEIENLSIQFSIEINNPATLEKIGKLENIQGVLLNNKIYLFGSRISKKEKTNTLYGCCLGMEGQVIEHWERISSQSLGVKKKRKKNENFMQGSYPDDDKYKVKLNNDSTAFITHYIDDKNLNCTVIVLDTSMHEKWKRNFSLEKRIGRTEVMECELDKNGNAYVLTRYSPLKKLANTPDVPEFILHFCPENDSLKQRNISFFNHDVYDVKLFITKKHTIMLAGNLDMSGVFMTSITDSLMELNNTRFPDRKHYIRDELSQNDFLLRKIIIADNGNVFVLCERYHEMVESTVYASTKGIERSYSHQKRYGDIICVKFAPNGETRWVTKVKKSGLVINVGGTRFLTCGFAYDGKNIHVVYNNHKRNYSKKTPPGTTHTLIYEKDANTIHAVIYPDGTTSAAVLFNNKKNSFSTFPSFTVQANTNSCIIFGRKGSKFKIGKIQF